MFSTFFLLSKMMGFDFFLIYKIKFALKTNLFEIVF